MSTEIVMDTQNTQTCSEISTIAVMYCRELARPRAVSPDQEVDQEVRRRQRDLQLDLSQHQGVPQVWRNHRKGIVTFEEKNGKETLVFIQ